MTTPHCTRGGYFGMRILDGFGDRNPEWEPWLLPVKIAYLVFAVMTWIADPLFNLLLRLNRFGRLALSREQVVASNWLGGCLLISLAMLAAYLATGNPAASWGAFGFGVLALPVSVVFRCQRGRPRWLMSLYTAAMALLILGKFVPLFIATLTPDAVWPEGLLQAAMGLVRFCQEAFLWSVVGSFWVANILIAMRPKY